MFLLIAVYCFAVGLCMMAGSPTETQSWPHHEMYYRGFANCFFSVMQVITLDSWIVDLTRPLANLGRFDMVVILFFLS